MGISYIVPRRSSNSPSTSEPSSIVQEDAAIPLRLAVAGGALSIELYESQKLEPIWVDSFSLRLPDVSFPVDLSGGVRHFRDRRGVLTELRLRIEFADLSKFLAKKLKNTLGGLLRRPSIWVADNELAIGLVGESGALRLQLALQQGKDGPELLLVESSGVLEGALSHATALQILDSSLADWGSRRGRVFSFEQPYFQLLANILPNYGLRIPSADLICVDQFKHDDAGLLVAFRVASRVAHQDTRHVLLNERSRGLSAMDDELAAGNLTDARSELLQALEDRPHDSELLRIVGEIDLLEGDRIESALGLLSESGPISAAGNIGAFLLAESGDLDGAISTLDYSNANEVFGPLASLAYTKVARRSEDTTQKIALLAKAVAASPSLTAPRWELLETYLHIADLAKAAAEVQQLEVAYSGKLARFTASLRCANRFKYYGFLREAGEGFERALRYLPDDPAATAGLAESLSHSGHLERSVALFRRSIVLFEEKTANRQAGFDVGESRLALAKLAVELHSDLSGAIALVRQIDDASSVLLEARGLECRWRYAIGDQQGYRQCLGRFRETVEFKIADLLHLGLDREPVVSRLVIDLLLESALVLEEHHRDLNLAERILATALRCAPQRRDIAERYREIAKKSSMGKASGNSELSESSPRLDDSQLSDGALDATVAHMRQPSEKMAEEAWAEESEPLAVEFALEPIDKLEQSLSADAEREALELRAERLKATWMLGNQPLSVLIELAEILASLEAADEGLALLRGVWDDLASNEKREFAARLVATAKQLSSSESSAVDEFSRSLWQSFVKELEMSAATKN